MGMGDMGADLPAWLKETTSKKCGESVEVRIRKKKNWSHIGVYD